MAFTIIRSSKLRQKDERINELESTVSTLQQQLDARKPKRGKDGKFITKKQTN